jgi:Gas vesicle protein
LPELATPTRSHGLVDVLDRVLDKGLVVAGDIKINLANVELLTIQIRLVVCSIDKAEKIGLNWWRSDPRLTATPIGHMPADTEDRLKRIEQQLQRLVAETPSAAPRRKGGGGAGK